MILFSEISPEKKKKNLLSRSKGHVIDGHIKEKAVNQVLDLGPFANDELLRKRKPAFHILLLKVNQVTLPYYYILHY